MKMTRYSENPILTKNDVPFAVNSIFNPGAVKFGNDIYFFAALKCRMEDHLLLLQEVKMV